jgi:ubiquinone/menaquinone biosynthesis C-methylase UbiE
MKSYVRGAVFALLTSALAAGASEPPGYRQGAASENGTGRFYLGREIAPVMGHQGADWLERPEREREEATSEMIKLLDLRPGQVVADIGSGTGYITRKLARGVGPDGVAHAVEIQPEMLALMQARLRAEGITNVVSTLGTIVDPKLPHDALDLVVMVDVYHEFSHPYEMLGSIVRSLKQGGRVVFVEFKGENPWVPILPLHKMTEAQVKKEVAVHPQLEWVTTHRKLPWQHVIVFRKKDPV